MVHVAIREQEKMQVYFKKQAQIKVQIEALLFNKALIEVSTEYFNYGDVFSAEYAVELPENIRINKHTIELEEGKQLPFGSIYNLEPVELETLKTYIKTNLANGFIWPSKSPAKTPILLNRKSNRSLRFCVDY